MPRWLSGLFSGATIWLSSGISCMTHRRARHLRHPADALRALRRHRAACCSSTPVRPAQMDDLMRYRGHHDPAARRPRPQIILRWSGATVVPYSEFPPVLRRPDLHRGQDLRASSRASTSSAQVSASLARPALAARRLLHPHHTTVKRTVSSSPARRPTACSSRSCSPSRLSTSSTRADRFAMYASRSLSSADHMASRATASSPLQAHSGLLRYSRGALLAALPKGAEIFLARLRTPTARPEAKKSGAP